VVPATHPGTADARRRPSRGEEMAQNGWMMSDDTKATLHRYLQLGRDALLWKVEGLGEYDVRRPLVPTGTNLLGIVKHVASIEAGYLGDCFGRPFPQQFAWFAEGAEENADMWATPQESREEIVDLYRRVWAHSDATVLALDADAVGHVPWWGEDGRDVTLHWILVHITTETHRHAGHADVVRELIDGAAGLRAAAANLPDRDAAWWIDYRERVEAAARAAAGAAPAAGQG